MARGSSFTSSAAKRRQSWWCPISALCCVRSWFLCLVCARRTPGISPSHRARRGWQRSLSLPGSLCQGTKLCPEECPFHLMVLKASTICHPQRGQGDFRTYCPRIHCFGIVTVRSCRPLRKSTGRERLSRKPPLSLFLPKDSPPDGTQLAYIPFLEVSRTRKDWLLS